MGTRNVDKPAGTAAPGAVAEEVRTETGAAVDVVGTSGAATAAGEALAVGGAGAGVGAQRVVEETGGLATREAEIVDGSTDDGRRAGTDANARGSTDGHVVRTFDVPARSVSGAGARAVADVAVVARRPRRDAILPLAEPVVDPTTVPGRRIATAAAQVRRGAVSYAPGETFPVDFKAYSELVPIGAIVATPWDELPDA